MSGRFVNKAIVERDGINSNEKRIIHFYKYPGKILQKRDLRKLVDVIYRNFQHLEKVQGINHTRLELTKLLTTNTSLLIIAMHKDSIAGYILADVVINNMRPLMHIYYLYTSPYYRGNGIATYMLNMIQDHASDNDISVLSLTYDTYNKPLTKFYMGNKFNYDDELRSYQRYDMLAKHI